jgi:hypothetical protein
MKAYFVASGSQKKVLFKEYATIVNTLEKLGIKVAFYKGHIDNSFDASDARVKKWRADWLRYMHECDFAVAEISYPSSINIGFEIGSMIAHGKPVLGLFTEGREPIFAKGDFFSKRFFASSYTTNNLNDVLTWGIEEIKNILDKRFTFLVPPEISKFLDKTYQEYNISASDFIRDLIKKEMKRLDGKENKKIK